jgi:Fe-S oxidoreductase
LTATPNEPAFWDRGALQKDLGRITDVCHGCRRCFNLCPSFESLFTAIDAHEEDPAKLTAQDHRKVERECFQCKLCFNHCPYTPPHAFDIDFPRQMLRAKSIRAREEGIPFADRRMADVDGVGRLGCLGWPISNWTGGLAKKVLGLHPARRLPPFARRTFASWAAEHVPAAPSPAVALFYSCSVNYNLPHVGRAAVHVLEQNGVELTVPPQRCCGMPYLDAGDVGGAREAARVNVESFLPHARAGRRIVSPGPTCSYVLKHDYPWLLGTPEAREVAAATMDLGEYLTRLKAVRLPVRETPLKIAYQAACHLRAQNIGAPSRDLLARLPGATVRTIERCSGLDGTWGLKAEFYDSSMKVARKLFDEILEFDPDVVATDCPLAALQIEHGTGLRPVHPVELLDRAYGTDVG